MEKTLRYKTFKGLISKTRQYSFNTYLSKRICHNKFGWCKYKITPELKQEIENSFKSVVGDIDLEMYFSCGLFDRLIINNNLRASYIGGQDYPSELRYLRKIIKRGYLK